MGIIVIYAKCQKKVNLSVKCVCTIKNRVKNSRLLSDTTKEGYSLEMFATDLVFFERDSGLIVGFNSEIVTKRPLSKYF